MIAYAQARLQARHGARPGPAAWAGVHAALSQGALLEIARASALEGWIAGLEPTSARGEIERLLRERLRGRIEEVARWMPPQWRPAVLHTRELLDLPARQWLLRGGSPLAWMAGEPGIARHLRDPPETDRATELLHEWLAAWRRTWPACAEADRHALEETVAAVEAHLQAFARAAADEAPGLRAALAARVASLFRRHALSPAAAFDHLLLLALEAERLRAELEAHA